MRDKPCRGYSKKERRLPAAAMTAAVIIIFSAVSSGTYYNEVVHQGVGDVFDDALLGATAVSQHVNFMADLVEALGLDVQDEVAAGIPVILASAANTSFGLEIEDSLSNELDALTGSITDWIDASTRSESDESAARTRASSAHAANSDAHAALQQALTPLLAAPSVSLTFETISSGSVTRSFPRPYPALAAQPLRPVASAGDAALAADLGDLPGVIGQVDTLDAVIDERVTAVNELLERQLTEAFDRAQSNIGRVASRIRNVTAPGGVVPQTEKLLGRLQNVVVNADRRYRSPIFLVVAWTSPLVVIPSIVGLILAFWWFRLSCPHTTAAVGAFVVLALVMVNLTVYLPVVLVLDDFCTDVDFIVFSALDSVEPNATTALQTCIADENLFDAFDVSAIISEPLASLRSSLADHLNAVLDVNSIFPDESITGARLATDEDTEATLARLDALDAELAAEAAYAASGSANVTTYNDTLAAVASAGDADARAAWEAAVGLDIAAALDAANIALASAGYDAVVFTLANVTAFNASAYSGIGPAGFELEVQLGLNATLTAVADALADAASNAMVIFSESVLPALSDAAAEAAAGQASSGSARDEANAAAARAEASDVAGESIDAQLRAALQSNLDDAAEAALAMLDRGVTIVIAALRSAATCRYVGRTYNAFKTDVCDSVRGGLSVLWGTLALLSLTFVTAIIAGTLLSKRAGFLYPEDKVVSKMMAKVHGLSSPADFAAAHDASLRCGCLSRHLAAAAGAVGLHRSASAPCSPVAAAAAANMTFASLAVTTGVAPAPHDPLALSRSMASAADIAASRTAGYSSLEHTESGDGDGAAAATEMHSDSSYASEYVSSSAAESGIELDAIRFDSLPPPAPPTSLPAQDSPSSTTGLTAWSGGSSVLAKAAAETGAAEEQVEEMEVVVTDSVGGSARLVMAHDPPPLTAELRAAAEALLPQTADVEAAEAAAAGAVHSMRYTPVVAVDVSGGRMGLGYAHSADVAAVDGSPARPQYLATIDATGGIDVNELTALSLRIYTLAEAVSSGELASSAPMWNELPPVATAVAQLSPLARAQLCEAVQELDAEAARKLRAAADARRGVLRAGWSKPNLRMMLQLVAAACETPLEADARVLADCCAGRGVAEDWSPELARQVACFILATHADLPGLAAATTAACGYDGELDGLVASSEWGVRGATNSLAAVAASVRAASVKAVLGDEAEAADDDDVLPQAVRKLVGGGRRAASRVLHEEQVEADARALYEAGEGKTLTTDVPVFVGVFVRASPAHLAAVSAAYRSFSFSTLMAALRDEIDPPLLDLLAALLDPVSACAALVRYALDTIRNDGGALFAFLATRAPRPLRTALRPVFLERFYLPLPRVVSSAVANTAQAAVEALVAAEPEVDEAAQALRKRLGQLHVNDGKAVAALASLPRFVRLGLALGYRRSYGVALATALKQRLGTRTAAVTAAALLPRPIAAANALHQLITEARGSKHAATASILVVCTLPHNDVLAAARAYRRTYGSELLSELARFLPKPLVAGLRAVADAALLDVFSAASAGRSDDLMASAAVLPLEAAVAEVEALSASGRSSAVLGADGILVPPLYAMVVHAAARREVVTDAIRPVLPAVASVAPLVAQLVEALVDPVAYVGSAVVAVVTRNVVKRWWKRLDGRIG
ncbi:uncharacterized protein AMSG_10368 [Thecamonas trahens ATCC 50062]|uniref:Uncharacterized protein n=1 Tax=Thecamonas trahens ATCC 50062 TaxID=461836 RepID=A0A0L0DQE3_THETB|nr:hypothetical protein AMSG_10368 [Thecamonas trahens ATCC 50062]KNC54522.1 hypothetical protein AMSG_10368 [Thecamonas trahens ATCC 50062]|eukprot:XP_013753539.1 hypothetical protein AMSG_10368 [Thecamonas trahens ATCC 50062]